MEVKEIEILDLRGRSIMFPNDVRGFIKTEHPLKLLKSNDTYILDSKQQNLCSAPVARSGITKAEKISFPVDV